MQKAKVFFIASAIIFFVGTTCFGADIAKIGILDFQKILTESSAGKQAQAVINKKGKEMETELKNKGATIEKQKENFERESLVMSRQMREEKERELRIMINDFKSLQKKYMNDFKEYEARLVKRIRSEILTIVNELAKKEGYLLVLERREGGVIYYPNTIDISDKVIQAYNLTVAKEGKAN